MRDHRIAVVLTSRASWAKLSTLCAALHADPQVELQIIACASALLERYGRVVDVVRREGFSIAAECWTVHEGENLITSAKETGALLMELASTFAKLRPDMVVVCADRHEVLAAAQAASYLHIPLCHLQGGEHSGSIDDRVRDAITHLSDYHMVSTKRALLRVYALTGAHECVWWVGCPSIDLAQLAEQQAPVTAQELGGSGADIDLAQPFVVVLQHPVTNEADDAGRQMACTLNAVARLDAQALVLWPGEDAGAAAISKAIRVWEGFHTLRSLPPTRFLKLLTQSACLIGNSSAGIRECSYLGVPVVNIGTRQHGRERGPNVIDVPQRQAYEIVRAAREQMMHGRYPTSELYGIGKAGARIAEVICECLSDRACKVG